LAGRLLNDTANRAANGRDPADKAAKKALASIDQDSIPVNRSAFHFIGETH
jgi:hypothetical protein